MIGAWASPFPDRGEPSVRAIGVDWSGARDPEAQRRHVWLAVVDGGELTELSAGRTRRETIEWLVNDGERRGPGVGVRTIAGLDFSFGFPAWFARAQGCGTGPDSWYLAALLGETWLRDCRQPFFGGRGTRRPVGAELYRETERRVAAMARVFPKSIFQLSGPGAVGPGSLRGMPLLTEVRARGWAVWPFDAATSCTVAEVYPAFAVGRRDLASVATPEGRRCYADDRWPGCSARWPALVTSRDAFDAAAAAFFVAGSAGVPPPPAPFGSVAALEGEIWGVPVPASRPPGSGRGSNAFSEGSGGP